jgi:hypothetical protein
MFGWKVAPRALAITAAALAVSLAAWPSLAGPSLRDMLFSNRQNTDGRRAPIPPVAKFRGENGVIFTVDRSTGVTLVKFDDRPEIWVLSSTRGPRGDVLYRDDSGQLFMKVTNLGGTILYGVRPEGEAVAFMGPAAAIRLQALNAQALLQRLAQASVRASRAAGRLVVFDAPDVTSGSEAVYADAAAVAAEAVASIAQRKNGKKFVQRIKRIQLVQTKKIEAHLVGDTLVVSIDPRRGVAGRPSSRKMVAAATH